MDRLRAIRYLVSAAEGASLSAAARLHGVSVAAVAKLIGALESDMRVQLLARHAHGVTPTVAGRMFLEVCRPALAQLDDAVEQVTASSTRVQGTVVIGVQPVVAQEVLTAALPKFCALYPDIQLDVRYFMNMAELQNRSLDAIIVMGWPQQVGDLVGRALGATTFVVVASPAYWTAHGMPQHPLDLEQHNCLCIRSNTGSVMDLWHFRRGDERVSVAARGSIIVDNVHRDMVRDLVLSGVGVARLLDWHQRPGREVPRGLLVPALTDWVVDEVPPVNLLYAPSVRRTPRVRVFLDWVVQLFAEVERERLRPLPATAMPHWVKMRRLRASETR
ncbi:LysR family transcriptional regulator [Hydrogenophaga aromaticivorans]|uniref:LysR family transcriptional regulator n=1 Tax=Hydrogenophaga aromaticivorans TaxID=2610898 RepID=UPI001B37DF92|nr:LysR family transcriptional regulator [Hydrogenophaga aromaticivorans]MBQ0921953.1 LysR family transcriptional regulator [Hydrogenophaga aromaticivorans]